MKFDYGNASLRPSRIGTLVDSITFGTLPSVHRSPENDRNWVLGPSAVSAAMRMVPALREIAIRTPANDRCPELSVLPNDPLKIIHCLLLVDLEASPRDFRDATRMTGKRLARAFKTLSEDFPGCFEICYLDPPYRPLEQMTEDNPYGFVRLSRNGAAKINEIYAHYSHSNHKIELSPATFAPNLDRLVRRKFEGLEKLDARYEFIDSTDTEVQAKVSFESVPGKSGVSLGYFIAPSDPTQLPALLEAVTEACAMIQRSFNIYEAPLGKSYTDCPVVVSEVEVNKTRGVRIALSPDLVTDLTVASKRLLGALVKEHLLVLYRRIKESSK